MSGPKKARYRLSPAQLAAIAERRRLTLELAKQQAKLADGVLQLAPYMTLFQEALDKNEILLQYLDTDGGLEEKVHGLRTIISSTKALATRCNKKELNQMTDAVAKVHHCKQQVQALSVEIAELIAKNDHTLNQKLGTAMDKGFEHSFIEVKSKAVSELEAMQAQSIEQLSVMLGNTELNPEYRARLSEAIKAVQSTNDIGIMKTFSTVTVSPLLKECNTYLKACEEQKPLFDDLYAEYRALCEIYYLVPQHYYYSDVSIQALEQEIQRISYMGAQEDEQAYISDCLDEVMTEMGYDVLGSREVTKKNGTHFRNELYHYGDGTAVNVTYSSDGRIAMEIGGIDHADRVPNAKETHTLCEAMEEFCDSFQEVEERLREKGVVVADRISMLPASAAYAQIINVSEYDLTTQVDKLAIKKDQRQVTKQMARKVE